MKLIRLGNHNFIYIYIDYSVFLFNMKLTFYEQKTALLIYFLLY